MYKISPSFLYIVQDFLYILICVIPYPQKTNLRVALEYFLSICGLYTYAFLVHKTCVLETGGRKSPIEEGGKTSSRKHRLITRTPGRRVIVLTGCVSIVCIFIREVFLRKECAMFKKNAGCVSTPK